MFERSTLLLAAFLTISTAALADNKDPSQSASSAALDRLRYEFSSAASEVGDALELLQAVDTDPDQLAVQTPNAVARVLAGIAKVKSLDELCKAKSLATVPAFGGKGTYRDPAVGCRLAASHRDLAAKYFERQVRQAVAGRLKSFESTINKAKSGDSIDVAKHLDLQKPARAVDELRAAFEKAAADFGFAVEAAWLEPLTAGAVSYAAALAEGAKTSRWDAKATLQDAQITAALAGDHSGAPDGLEKGKVLRAAAFADWSVEKDYRNKPVSRSRSVLALVKIDGEAHCRVYMPTFEAQFKNGAWGRPYAKGGATFQVSACK